MFPHMNMRYIPMAKLLSERRHYVLHVGRPTTRSVLGVHVYDSHPPPARYVWYVTCYLHSSCCSETQYAHVHFKSYYGLSTLTSLP